MGSLRRWLGEPLLHFFVLGAALFGLHRWAAPPVWNNRIELSPADLRGLRQDFVRRTGKPPAPEDEAAMIRHHVDSEILYREALAMGLDRGDIIVRRRLIQKMEFLTEDLEPVPEPNDTELQEYMDTHAERYAVAERVSLAHVFVSRDRHGDQTAALARLWRDQLERGADAAGLGDPFLRGGQFALHTESELGAIFGPAFASQVMALPAGVWAGPVESSFGAHIVRVGERRSGRRPALDEVRTTVRRDWREDHRGAANRLALDRLRRRYEVRVSGADSGALGEPRAEVSE